MFSSVNFLFLLSLGAISWVLLCYFKQVETMLASRDKQIEEYLATNTTDSALLKDAAGYGVFANTFCVFACIFLFTKLSDYTKDCLAKHLHNRYSWRYLATLKNKLKALKDSSATQQQKPTENIEDLRERNFGLEHELNIINRTNSILRCREAINRQMEGKTEEEQQEIRNHLKGQFYLNEGNVRPLVHELDNGRGNEFTLIWQKYFSNDKFVLRETLTHVAANNDVRIAPIVLSTEDLHRAHGLF